MGEEYRRSDHLDPVTAYCIFRVVSQDSPPPKDCLFVEDLTQNLKGIVFVQLILVEVVQEKLEPVDYLVAVELEILRAVLQKVDKILDNLIDFNVLDLIGNVLLQIGVAFGGIPALLLI